MRQKPYFKDDTSHSPTEALSLRPREAAAALGVSLSTLDRLTRAGEIPYVKLGRVVLYPREALKHFLTLRVQVMKGGEA